MKHVVKQMIDIGNEQLKGQKEDIPFTKNSSWNKLLNDIEDHSHLFVLGCVGDKQIKALRAWGIPMLIGEQIGSYEFKEFDKLSRSDYIDLFEQNKYHRFNSIVGNQYYDAIKKIKQEYNSKANQIWKNGNSAQIFGRFLQFDGFGQKIASMAVNILVRHFK